MTYDNADIEDLTVFASEHDDELWGSEPTKPHRPSSLRPPVMLPPAPPKRRLTFGVGLAIAFTLGFGSMFVLLCCG